MKNSLKETVITLALVSVAVLLLNPFDFWMPDVMVICMLASVLALFGLFAIFILRERVVDERDKQHQSLAGRNAFLIGSGIITLGIVVQGYEHSVDPWLVVALVSMVFAKLITRHWSDRNL